MHNKFQQIFPNTKPIIAMIHVQALPGTPFNKYKIDEIIEKALMEARLYKRGGVDAIALENMHDIPYLKREVGPEISSAMAVVAYEVKKEIGLPSGLQILAGANKAALAAAQSAGLDFIRAEGFVFGHVADEGIMESDAGTLLRYRKTIGAEDIAIFTDIKKKHSSHTITADTSIVETAHAAEFFNSDGVIITGQSTGEKASTNEIEATKAKVKIPVLIGSGINIGNVADFLQISDGLIVGSHFKENNHWAEEVSYEKVCQFMEKVNAIRVKLH